MFASLPRYQQFLLELQEQAVSSEVPVQVVEGKQKGEFSLTVWPKYYEQVRRSVASVVISPRSLAPITRAQASTLQMASLRPSVGVCFDQICLHTPEFEQCSLQALSQAAEVQSWPVA